MKIKNKQSALYLMTFYLLMLLSASVYAGLQSLDDDQLSGVSGQALFMSQKEVSGSYTYYKMGLDAQLDINANIAELKLGETSGAGAGIDLWAKNLALGCVANASNVCVNSDTGTGTKLKPFTLLRPFIQVATKGANAATREVVGIRLGAQNAVGPMSIGNFEVFSGYLTATANIEMQEQGKGRNPDDIAVTCGPSTGPCPGTLGGDGRNTFGLNEPLRSLGLDNDQACVLAICAAFNTLTVSYNGVNRTNLPVVMNGRRQTQALISNILLSDAVDTLSDSINIVRSSGALGAGLINAIKGLIIGQVKTKIKNQLAASLGVPLNNNAALNAYQMPFNAQNLHSADVNSNLFGLSFQKEAGVQYPGYAVAMQKGWSMYLPNAFTLGVSQPTTQFVSNIQSGAAAAGNVIPLPDAGGGRVYDNCWGTTTFC